MMSFAKKIPFVKGLIERGELIDKLKTTHTGSDIAKNNPEVFLENAKFFKDKHGKDVWNANEALAKAKSAKAPWYNPFKNSEIKRGVSAAEKNLKDTRDAAPAEALAAHYRNAANKMNEMNAAEIKRLADKQFNAKVGLGVGAAALAGAGVALRKPIKSYVTRKIIQKKIKGVVNNPYMQTGVGLAAGVGGYALLNKKENPTTSV
jgi:hypothetical protein